MATEWIPQLTFKCTPKTKTVARFDQAQASTDGGVVLLKALDDRLQLTDRLAACLPDRRDPDKIRPAVRDLLRQRIFGLACGYEDGLPRRANPWSLVGCSHGLPRPSRFFRPVGPRDFTFEACSGFTRVAARRLADPPTVGLCPQSFDQSVPLLAILVATGVSRQLPRQDLHL